MNKIAVQEADFDIAQEYQAMRQDNPNDGAIVFFTGLVRDFNQGKNVTGLFLEHYPGMTEKSLENIVEQAKQRWPINRVSLIHRIGQLHISDQIVFVSASSPHREAAFDACRFIMDYLKHEAPFWKKETTQEGDRWVKANQKDKDALKKW
ncbi:molybdopterin synthase catalytic subunit MoaE [Bermanella marisrubri]|uniref:Molybdopterin synthase catalytic subunit n=1 Tax=Bermanella marisrubri TaxID=207949 RepID=Q1MYU0_9GAMM|nr:molybdopterin synthase catalytic subunit MoaE [Bermanella marisrubri]EAT11116.1 molybdenum cofactor biosynthesis protein E [Oceanobacter sp. RED65] [Bermanella marisrubri]QIZ83444.1 molybdopterin synthase catalytic subunit MoaE [Bermanella marisrubri]